MEDEAIPASAADNTVLELLDRVLNTGVVLAGDVKIKLCDIELLTTQIRLLVASADKAQQMELTWRWQTPTPAQGPHFVPGQAAAIPPGAAQSPWKQYVPSRDTGQQAQT